MVRFGRHIQGWSKYLVETDTESTEVEQVNRLFEIKNADIKNKAKLKNLDIIAQGKNLITFIWLFHQTILW